MVSRGARCCRRRSAPTTIAWPLRSKKRIWQASSPRRSANFQASESRFACGCTPARSAKSGTLRLNCAINTATKTIRNPADTAEVPDRRLPPDSDPDELLAIVHAYAGQISLLDLCLGGLLDCLAGQPGAENTLLAVLSARGFPLGEHGRVGACDDALYAELTHMPLLLRLPDGHGASARTQALVQPADLHATLLDWCGQPIVGHSSPAFGNSLLPIVEGRIETVRDRACTFASAEERAIVTAAWSMRLGAGASGGSRGTRDRGPSGGSEAAVELFAKPDDWFEVNEVSDRCGEVAAEMEQAFIQFEQACQTADPAELPPLPTTLITGLD